MKIGAGRVRSDVAHLYSLKDHGHGVLSEPKIMARRARTPENEACELGVALISWGTCWKSWGQSWVTDEHGRRITVGQSLEPLKRSPGSCVLALFGH